MANKEKHITYHTSLKKTLILYIICCKCKNKNEKIFEEKDPIEIVKNIKNYFKKMGQQFRLKSIDKTRNFYLEEIEQIN